MVLTQVCEDNNGKTLLGIAVGREEIEMVKLVVARVDVKSVSRLTTVRPT